MKFFHLAIIILPVAISLAVIAVYVIPFVVPVQPLRAEIIGYHLFICHTNLPNTTLNECGTSPATVFGENSYTFHKGDQFTLVVSVHNPNLFSIDPSSNFFSTYPYSTSVTFDKNAINYHYEGCSAVSEGISLASLTSTEITIPNGNCDVLIANSKGKTNATVHIQYVFNGKLYNDSAGSQIFTILPKT